MAKPSSSPTPYPGSSKTYGIDRGRISTDYAPADSPGNHTGVGAGFGGKGPPSPSPQNVDDPAPPHTDTETT